MSLAVAIYARLRENRATGLSVGLPVGRLVGRSFVRSLGRMVVAANMLKIIGLVALLIPGRHRARLLIVRVHPDARTNGTLFFRSLSTDTIVTMLVETARWCRRRVKVRWWSSPSGNSIYRMFRSDLAAARYGHISAFLSLCPLLPSLPSSLQLFSVPS